MFRMQCDQLAKLGDSGLEKADNVKIMLQIIEDQLKATMELCRFKDSKTLVPYFQNTCSYV